MRILSLGAGVQSSTLALMAAKGVFSEMPDAAIFADTGWEPLAVYKWLDYLERQLPFPVYRVSKGDIRSDLILGCTEGNRFASVPFFTEGGGMGRRQCTAEYKILPVQRKIRELAGIEPRKHAKKILADLWIGISTDEIQRVKPSQVKWLFHRWPLIETRMSREDCLNWMEKNGYPQPPKSSCIGCPFHSDLFWADMKEKSPKEFKDAVYVDSIIRNGGKLQNEKQFMHRSLTPLNEVVFSNKKQPNHFINECEGMCGV